MKKTNEYRGRELKCTHRKGRIARIPRPPASKCECSALGKIILKSGATYGAALKADAHTMENIAMGLCAWYASFESKPLYSDKKILSTVVTATTTTASVVKEEEERTD